LDKADTRYIQQVAGMLLYYGQAVDTTILPALSSIATEQAAPMERTMAKVKQLLDYCASHEEAIITYNVSKMVLTIHSKLGYANEKRQEVVRGNIFLVEQRSQPTKQWCNINEWDNHQKCNVISGRSRNWCTLPKCKRSGLPLTNINRNGTPAITCPDSD
jgi:hypothetical protein